MDDRTAVEVKLSEEEMMRAQLYGMLSGLLAEVPKAEVIQSLTKLEGDDTEIGKAFAALAVAAKDTTPEQAEDEYNALFVGMGTGGAVTPFASQYETGFLYDTPLAELRQKMSELGIAYDGEQKEPEDHIAFILEIMHAMITGTTGIPSDMETQREFFDSHIANWAAKFFEDLENANPANFYKPVGTLGRLFLAVEVDAFAMG